MPSSLRPTVAMLDAWRLIGEAVEVGALVTARGLADRVLASHGWDRYTPGLRLHDDEVFECVAVPRGWAYYARLGRYDQRLLINPDACQLLSDYGYLARTMRAAEQLGPGLVRLDAVLAEVLMSELTPPEDASELRVRP